MNIERNHRFRVEGHEIDKGNEILIEHIALLIDAPTIEQACRYARNYFGMGVTFVVTKCEQI